MLTYVKARRVLWGRHRQSAMPIPDDQIDRLVKIFLLFVVAVLAMLFFIIYPNVHYYANNA